MGSPFIYFDHAATTALDERVFEAMKPYFSELYGNPSSVYEFAQKARTAVDSARETVAEILECSPREIIFTSGGTEANNLFIFGTAGATSEKRHIITTKIEHDSVREPLKRLQAQGFEVTYLNVGENGIVNPADVARAIRDNTLFISLIYANNEIGTIQPIAEIAKLVRKKRSSSGKNDSNFPLLHVDACQAAPYLNIFVKKLGVDAMTLNGGKIYGPKGMGALYLRDGIELQPQILGGGQEHRKRSGTENVPAIVGFAEALKLIQANREKESSRVLTLRNKLIDGILRKIPDTRLNGDYNQRLPNNANISFRGLLGETILQRLDMIGVAASAGSACTSGSLEPSHVIQALGLTEEWTRSATRFSLGHGNTEREVDFLLEKLPVIIKELRKVSPFQ